MAITQIKLTQTFKNFFESDKTGGILLAICAIVSLTLANSQIGPAYIGIWHLFVAGLSLEHWINDALMAVFFLLIGLELKREMYNGELSDIKNALLPIFAAIGGIVVPASIHFAFNSGTPSQDGIGIPMATDIVFALAALSLLGNRVPASLKVFLAALAVVDDLGAILVIALFYTAELSMAYLIGALIAFGSLYALNRILKVASLVPYILGGMVMWLLMLKSGVHATLAGVLLAFAIPYSRKEDDATSPSHIMENFLHKPVTLFILPLFALANTGVVIGSNWASDLTASNSMGIIGGLVLGKPLGIVLLSLIAVALGVCRLPPDLRWPHVLGAGLLGGVGFTMSIFITNLAFAGDPAIINSSKMAILAASMVAGLSGVIWLTLMGRSTVQTAE